MKVAACSMFVFASLNSTRTCSVLAAARTRDTQDTRPSIPVSFGSFPGRETWILISGSEIRIWGLHAQRQKQDQKPDHIRDTRV